MGKMTIIQGQTATQIADALDMEETSGWELCQKQLKL